MESSPVSSPELQSRISIRDVKTVSVEGDGNQAFPPNIIRTSRYTVWSFLPVFLWEQLHPRNKFANFYFLVVCILQTLPWISITNGLPTTILPLGFVLLVEGINVAVEDYQRHKADTRANANPVHIFDRSTQQFVRRTWADVRVGDIVKVMNREIFPADLLFLTASDPQHARHCFVNTKSLDGETDNKLRLAMQCTYSKLLDDAKLLAFAATVECELPNENTSDFAGTLCCSEAQNGREPIEAINMLLRGCMLRNTDWVLGLVISTAADTKIEYSQRHQSKEGKTASINKLINREIVILVAILFTMCLVGGIGFAVFNASKWDELTYLQWSNRGVVGLIQYIFIYFLLNYQFIPVSLYVSLSMVYTIQRWFMVNDPNMFDGVNEEPPLVRTMNLNDELGQVSYIFSDKTGTLTGNLMEFRKCNIAGVNYGSGTTDIGLARMRAAGMDVTQLEEQLVAESRRPTRTGLDRYVNFDGVCESDAQRSIKSDIARNDAHMSRIREFMLHLALNHTVLLEVTRDEHGNERKELSASSPDEQAFVAAAYKEWFEFVGRNMDEGTITLRDKVTDQNLTFRVLKVLEYVSYRKRMSVIVQDEDGRIVLYCKGADSALYERLSSSESNAFQDELLDQMGTWAEDALRTLVFARRELDPEQYAEWAQRYYVACEDHDERARRKRGQPNRIDDLMSEAESELELQGATAIEDKLQDGVPMTLQRLGAAGIKIWMITGDKVGTARNIAVACSLVQKDMHQFLLTEDSFADMPLGDNQQPLSELRGKVLVDIAALAEEGKMTEAELEQAQLKTCFPALEELQKRLDEATAWLKANPGVPATLVIDEKIIDFALLCYRPQLLTVACNCASVVACRARKDQKKKLTELIKNSMPDVITLGIGDGANDVDMIRAAHIGVGVIGKEGMQAVNNSDYAIGQFRFLERLLLVHGRNNYRRNAKLVCYMFYKNIMLVSAAYAYSIIAGFSAQKVFPEAGLQLYNVAFTAVPVLMLAVFDKDVPEMLALQRPDLYGSGIRRLHFNHAVFWMWQANALLSAVAVLLICTFGLHASSGFGESIGMFELGATVFTAIVLIANVKIVLETYQLHLLYVAVLFLTIASWIVVAVVISVTASVEPEWVGMVQHVFGLPGFWFSIILSMLVVNGRDMYWKGVRRVLLPELYHVVQHQWRGWPSESPTEDADKKRSHSTQSNRELLAEQKSAGISLAQVRMEEKEEEDTEVKPGPTASPPIPIPGAPAAAQAGWATQSAPHVDLAQRVPPGHRRRKWQTESFSVHEGSVRVLSLQIMGRHR